MPVTGSIRYEGYRLYLFFPMASLWLGRSMPKDLRQMPPPLAVAFDDRAEGIAAFVTVVSRHALDFHAHIRSLFSPMWAPAGLFVWEGSAVFDSSDISFEGQIRRPTSSDHDEFSRLLTQRDQACEEEILEHAKHCQSCARKVGLDPSEVVDNAEGLPAIAHPTDIARA
jgi:hypothetical protein